MTVVDRIQTLASVVISLNGSHSLGSGILVAVSHRLLV